MIRALRPTDAVAYFAFFQQAPRNAAVGPLGVEPPGSIASGFVSRSFGLEPHREHWVQIEHGRIAGLVAVKRRQGSDVWDIDELVVPPAPDAGRTASRL